MEMRRVALTLVGALLAISAGTTSASAAPIDVDAEPEKGGVVVTATVTVEGFPTIEETITTGQLAADVPFNENESPGLCAFGPIHTSCTPADEASER